MADVRVLLFDFGNVIGFFDHHRGAAQVAALLGAEPGRVYDYFFGTDLEDRYEKGQITSDELLALLRAEFAAAHGPPEELARAFGSIFWRNELVIDVIRRLPPAVKLVLGSNTNELHHRVFGEMFADVFARFDAIVLSYTAGCRKPHHDFFRHCLKQAECDPHEMLFFDDRADNIEGAAAVGIRGVIYTPDVDLATILREHGIELANQ